MSQLENLFKRLSLANARHNHLQLIQRAEDEQWSYHQLLETLVVEELAFRQQTRIKRLVSHSGFPFFKTIDEFDFTHQSTLRLAMLGSALSADFVTEGSCLIFSGPPGRGKTHFLAALGRELILRHGKRVLFRPAFKLVGKLLAAKRDLRLEAELKKLDRYDVLILDDIGYVQQSREEMEVLFTLLAERYERRSLLISSNLVFSQWDQIFKDPLTTMAAIDRLVHHSIILEFDGASQRVKKAAESAAPPTG